VGDALSGLPLHLRRGSPAGSWQRTGADGEPPPLAKRFEASAGRRRLTATKKWPMVF
jgi:hypothetical protein